MEPRYVIWLTFWAEYWRAILAPPAPTHTAEIIQFPVRRSIRK